MIITKEIKWKVNNKYIKRYKNLGYTSVDGYMYIKIEDLLPESNYKIAVKCDICEKENYISYQKYNKNISKYNIYTCLKCSNLKNKKTNLIKYGKENPKLCENNLEKWTKNKEQQFLEKEKNKENLLKNGGKICKLCKEFKTIDNFTKRDRYSDGTYNICKKCVNDKRNKKYNHNKELLLPKIRLRKRKYAINNKDKINKSQREYYHKKFKITNKINFIWRGVLNTCLKRMNRPKNNSTIKLLGYSPIELKNHLENNFTTGMTWKNYGFWHVDHIKCVSSFEKDTPMNIVNALSNLKPMWSTNRIIDGIFYKGNLNKGKNSE